jgi:hypothetical protein
MDLDGRHGASSSDEDAYEPEPDQEGDDDDDDYELSGSDDGVKRKTGCERCRQRRDAAVGPAIIVDAIAPVSATRCSFCCRAFVHEAREATAQGRLRQDQIVALGR